MIRIHFASLSLAALLCACPAEQVQGGRYACSPDGWSTRSGS